MNGELTCSCQGYLYRRLCKHVPRSLKSYQREKTEVKKLHLDPHADMARLEAERKTRQENDAELQEFLKAVT